MTSMTIATKVMKRAVCAVLHARVQLAQARLHVLTATVQASKARLELKAIKKLMVQERTLERAVAKWAVAGAGAWGRTRGHLEARIAALEAAVHTVESKLRAS